MSHQGKKSLVDVVGEGKRCVWNKKVKGTTLETFREVVNKTYDLRLENYWDLHKWSVEHYDKFWEEIWKFFKIISSNPYDEVVTKGNNLIDVEWFRGALFNFAENVLRYRDDHVAIIGVDEDGGEEFVTYVQMYEEIKLYAAAFKKHGLKTGDRVACYMSNRKEPVFAMLAAASMGAVFGGPLHFFGEKAAKRIIHSMAPKFLLTCDRFKHKKLEHNLVKNLPFIVNDMEFIEKVVIVQTKERTLSEGILLGIKNSCTLKDFLESGKDENRTVPELQFKQLPVNQPLFITFTSGTTGIPKGIVHSAGIILPFLLNHSLDRDRTDITLSFYPMGWTVSLHIISNFFCGTSVLLYEGYPCLLSKTYFWDLTAKYKVTDTLFSASTVDQMEKNDIVPGTDCNLENLRTFGFGGCPVKLQNFDYIYRVVKRDILVQAAYGSTECKRLSGFAMNELAYSGEIQVPALGVNIRCYNSNGEHVVGERGELVVAGESMFFPLGIWNDPNNETLHKLYLDKFPGAWDLNDEGWINPDTKGMIVLGRSDDKINQKGVCFFPADIYSAIHTMEELEDYLCVSQDNASGDQRAVLFVKVKEGIQFNGDLVEKIKKQVEDELFVHFVPEIVLETKEVPYNFTDKKMDRIVRSIIATNVVPEASTIKNPECLEMYCNIPELQNY